MSGDVGKFMEFNEKLQELRKQKELTQEELAEVQWFAKVTYLTVVLLTIAWGIGTLALQSCHKYFCNILLNFVLEGNIIIIINI